MMKRPIGRLPDWHAGTEDSAYGRKGIMEKIYFNLLTYTLKIRLPVKMDDDSWNVKLATEFTAVIAPHLDAIAQELAAIEPLVVLSVER